MRESPDEIEVSSRYSQKEIEVAFDTGFGYQISGINPRRDKHDNRYVLVFANEDGPYDDDVMQGRFEYIGEGLTGDQSKKSPGNSTLIGARESDIPVHFFYKRTSGEGWEYQGRISVLDYEFREQGGREVLVFTMEHRDHGEEPAPDGLYLIPVSEEWRERFRTFVEQPHNFRQYDEVPPQLEGYNELRIWGTTKTTSSKKRAAINQMQSGDCILFYHSSEFIAGARVQRTFESSEVGPLLWNEPDSRHIFTLEKFTVDVPHIAQVWDWLGRDGREVVQGFTRVKSDHLVRVRQEYGSVHEALFGSERAPTEKEVEKELSTLAGALEQPPQLTEDDEQYTQSQRRARNAAFARLVKETYQGQCAVCGSN